MKKILLLLLFTNLIYSQDGSDIIYVKPIAFSESLVGKFVHFDFYNRSFKSNKIDTIELNINAKFIIFNENRNENGFNNWFANQFLISEDKSLKISKFQIRNIDKKQFYVTAFLNHIENNKIERINLLIEINKIAEILVESKQNSESKILYYNAISCTCPNWILENSVEKSEIYYLEPINESILDASKLWNGKNLPLKIKVIGNLISENDYPDYFSEKQINKGAEKGKIFRYTKIEIITE